MMMNSSKMTMITLCLLLICTTALRLGYFNQIDLSIGLDEASFRTLLDSLDMSRSEATLTSLLWDHGSVWLDSFCRHFPLHDDLPSHNSIVFNAPCLDRLDVRRGYPVRSSLYQIDLERQDVDARRMVSLLDPATVNFDDCDETFIISALLKLLQIAESTAILRIHCLTRMFAIMRWLRLDGEQRDSFHRIHYRLKAAVRLVYRRDWSNPARGLLRQVLASNTIQLSASVCTWLRMALNSPPPQSDLPTVQAKLRRYTFQNQLMILYVLSCSPLAHESWLERFRRLLAEARMMLTMSELAWFIQAIPGELLLRLDGETMTLLRKHHLGFLGGDEQRQRMLEMRSFPRGNDAMIHDTVYLHFLSRNDPRLGDCNDAFDTSRITGLYEAYGRLVLCCLRHLTTKYFQPVRRRPTLAIAPLLVRESEVNITRFHLTPTIHFTVTGIMLKRAFQWGLRLPFHFDGHTMSMFKALLNGRRDLIALHARDLKAINEIDTLSQSELRYLDRFTRLDGTGLSGFHFLMTGNSSQVSNQRHEQVNLKKRLLNRFKDCLHALFDERIFAHADTWTLIFS